MSCSNRLGGLTALLVLPLLAWAGTAPEHWLDGAPDFRLQQALGADGSGPAHSHARIGETGLGLHAPGNGRYLGRVPDAVLALDEAVDYLLIADLTQRRLFLLENGEQLNLLRHMYASIGKNGSGKQVRGDGRTPLGVYAVTQYLDGSRLPPLYGTGAFPVDYPNDWDRRAGRTGDGIWLHGVPTDHYSRPPRSSEGCVTVVNDDLDSLKAFVAPGNTRVIFSDSLEWVSPRTQAAQRREFLARLEAWREAWQSLDTDAYLAHYAEDFTTDGMDRQAFAAHKRRVNRAKSYIELELGELNLFRYPGEDEMILAEFVQDYRSDNYAGVMRKRQFWRRDGDGSWRIVFEGEG